MSSRIDEGTLQAGLRTHGYVGFIGMVAAGALLIEGNEFVSGWFTPIMWTFYILFVDALVYKLQNRSLLVNDRREFLILAVVSIANWWLFELYNAPRFWNSNLELWWHYHNIEPNLFVRRIGYDWAFATISPAMFETADLLRLTVFRRKTKWRAVGLSRTPLRIISAIGAALAILPLVVLSGWFAPLVWLSFILFFDPINALAGRPSILRDIGQGAWRRTISLLGGGALCGVLWEFWNYWAATKWTYTVPYFGGIRLFEMPVLGYLGFPPFAIECWATYVLIRGWALGSSSWEGSSVLPPEVSTAAVRNLEQSTTGSHAG
ncbi:MAG TPA: hypothetical protein VKM94_14640 [Blastocatellia bacterium]|nr:hypothetical protein [Blastocatellia bacterium]